MLFSLCYNIFFTAQHLLLDVCRRMMYNGYR
nr:MAG TPA: hypothetical protein [Caudoviricetes sp.]